MYHRTTTFIALLFFLAAVGIAQASSCTAQNCTYIPMVQPKPLVRVKSYRMFVNSVGNLLVAGEVVNETTTTIYHVDVSGKFYDADGIFLFATNSLALFYHTEPSHVNPFQLYRGVAPETVARVDLSVTYDTESMTQYQHATVLSRQVRDSNGAEVYGQLRNDHSQELHRVQVIATFYDAAGSVYDNHSGTLLSTLAPGATSPYTVTTFKPELNGLQYRVQAEGSFPP